MREREGQRIHQRTRSQERPPSERSGEGGRIRRVCVCVCLCVCESLCPHSLYAFLFSVIPLWSLALRAASGSSTGVAWRGALLVNDGDGRYGAVEGAAKNRGDGGRLARAAAGGPLPREHARVLGRQKHSETIANVVRDEALLSALLRRLHILETLRTGQDQHGLTTRRVAEGHVGC